MPTEADNSTLTTRSLPGTVRGGGRGSAALIVSAAVMLAVPHLGLPSGLREALVVGYTLSVPGWAFTRLLKLGNPALEVAVAIALSMSFLILVSFTLLEVHGWGGSSAFELCMALAALGGLTERALP
jgi:hypothetical protein